MTRVRYLLALLLGLMIAAAVPPAAAQSAADWYEIEIIVFRQPEPTGANAELHPVDPPPPEASQVVSLRQPGAGGVPYEMLRSGDLKLGGVYESLEQSERYEPLLHIGWRQPGVGESAAASVAIPPEWQPWSQAQRPPLHGLVRFHKERYLHLAVDLRYQPPAVAADEPELALDGTMTEIVTPTYVHQQSRRLRTGELHYLDHPTLGVVVEVRQVGGN